MNTKTTPKDFFLHLAATIVLYVSAIALINLCFSAVNYALPDQLSGYFSTSSIAWPISMLVVLVPLLYILEWFLGRDITKMPEKRDLWIRRWRIYLTLFLTGATIAGDLIVLINTYINGEITSRFIYKILIVLVISVVIFTYYLLERLATMPRTKKWQMILAWLGIIIVLGGIIGGFTIVGSPGKQRSLRFDDQRLSDLMNVQGQIINYWQTKGSLPISLSDLSDSISGFAAPNDPENHSSYEYSVAPSSSPLSPHFQLCATFALPYQDTSGRGGYAPSYAPYPYYPGSDSSDVWKHGAGRACFDRTIDPEKYPVQPKPIQPKGI